MRWNSRVCPYANIYIYQCTNVCHSTVCTSTYGCNKVHVTFNLTSYLTYRIFSIGTFQYKEDVFKCPLISSSMSSL